MSARVDELIPFFLKAGYLMYLNYEREDTFIATTRDLPNQYDVYIAFDSEGKSSGQFLDLENYNENDTFNYCIEKSCVVQVDVSSQIVSTHQKDASTIQEQSTPKLEKIEFSFDFMNQNSNKWHAPITIRSLNILKIVDHFSHLKRAYIEEESATRTPNTLEIRFKQANDSLVLNFFPNYQLAEFSHSKLYLEYDE